jgi:putative hydrolase of the HAD superfamily
MVDIKNIIFDFGGVIINISHQRVENAFKALGVSNLEALFNQASQSALFQQFETGEITASQFRDCIRELTQISVTDQNLDDAWNQIIGDYPPKRIDLLNQIKQNYRLFLLSNTNIIHYNHYIPKFEREFGYSFESLFEKAYWSFKFGERKPELASFYHVIYQSRLKTGDTLFIDDSIQNIKAAHEVGLKTVHLTHDVDITEIFTNGEFNQTFLFK